MIRPGMNTFSELVELAADGLRPTMEQLRRTILEIDPQAVEVVRLGERAASYGCGPRKMIDGYAYIMPQRSWVNLGFFRGASLPDPHGLLEGTGVGLRHVKMRSRQDTERPGVRELIESACTERRRARNP